MDPKNHSSSGKYEHRDVNTGPIFIFGVGLMILIAVALLTAYVFQIYLNQTTTVGARFAYEGKQEPPIPQPQLSIHPSREYEILREKEQRMLTSYGWVNREQGIARIPVDYTLKDVATQDLPFRQGTKND